MSSRFQIRRICGASLFILRPAQGVAMGGGSLRAWRASALSNLQPNQFTFSLLCGFSTPSLDISAFSPPYAHASKALNWPTCETREPSNAMGVQKKTRKFAKVKRIIGQRDARLKQNQQKAELEAKKAKKDEIVREMYVV